MKQVTVYPAYGNRPGDRWVGEVEGETVEAVVVPVDLKPFIYSAAKDTDVRGYSIGPQHCDWLCVRCGAVGHDLGGMLLEMAQDQAAYDLVCHLQQHVRFDSIDLV